MTKFVITKHIEANNLTKLHKTYFLNYIRIKNYIYNQMVQTKNIKGLIYFQSEYYNKNSDFHDTSLNLTNEKKLKRAMLEQFQNEQLTKLELRISIKENEAQFTKIIKDFLEDYKQILEDNYCIKDKDKNKYLPNKSFPRVELVCHLIKSESSLFIENCFNQNNHINFKYIQVLKLNIY